MCVARLVAAGPPVEEGVQPQDEIADEIVEVPLPAHEEVRTPRVAHGYGTGTRGPTRTRTHETRTRTGTGTTPYP